MVKPAIILPPQPDERWEFAKQMGVTDVVIHPIEIGDGQTSWTHSDLQSLQQWLEGDELSFTVLEGSVPLTDRTRLGLDGRDDEIEQFKQLIRDCGDLGIPVICYDWMAGVRWARTGVHIEGRGGSLVTGYDNTSMKRGPSIDASEKNQEDIFEALAYFLKEVIPVAEEAGVKLGLHPDDPPRESLHGVPRIANSVENYDRILNIYDSEYNGMTYCQGNFAAMGADIPETIHHFGEKINFIHFRDIEGNADQFVETWHDNGPTDMHAAMEAYLDAVDDDVPIRPDHVPTMEGEDNSNPGYHTKARLFAIGYMRGLRQAIE